MMNAFEFHNRIDDLEREGRAYALATVVVRRSPVSAHLGDRAIVYADGRMHGFVGGSCSRDIVRRQSLDAIRTGRPRLLQIRPDRNAASLGGDAETVVVPMTCSSEGAVDVYIEPHLPPRTLLAVGYTPVAEEFTRLASGLEGYRVVRVVAPEELRDLPLAAANAITLDQLQGFLAAFSAAERARLVAVVASQGHYDETALGALLAGEMPAFVGLLASRKRAATVFGVLEQEGIAHDRIERVHNPVGFDIGARTPGEVAVSILAEIIAEVARTAPPLAAHDPAPATAIDPICGMEVEIASASHRAERDGTGYYFCCAGCRATFLASVV